MALRIVANGCRRAAATCTKINNGMTHRSISYNVSSSLLNNAQQYEKPSFQPMIHTRSKSTLSLQEKVALPPMVYISGEEMTHYASELIVDKWIKPYFDITNWEHYDLSCKARDETDDKVLSDAVEAGKRLCAIFKEPTITPSAKQVKEMGLSKPFGSPNGAMRRGWNGITISRDTIHIEGIELGYKNPVLFERHAVGGEYGAGWNEVGKGTLLTTYLPEDKSQPPFVVDKRDLTDDHNVCVVYHNPYDNVEDLAHIFFKRCLEAKVTPFVVTKKTVFKWQEGFWNTMKSIFDKEYKQQFLDLGLLDKTGGTMRHLISDAATMQLIRWTDGGFGMAAHNYDGDMLTDQVAQVHRSPGFITSNLIGKTDDGSKQIKEFEASHGTVSDLWADHLEGKETSLNPLGLVEAMMGAMEHSAKIHMENAPLGDVQEATILYEQVTNYTDNLRRAMHNTFRYGQGTRDMSGPTGFTTEDFIDKVAWRLHRYLLKQLDDVPPMLQEPPRQYRRNFNVDDEKMKEIFAEFDVDDDGTIDFSEFKKMVLKLGVAPEKIDIQEADGEEEVKEPWSK